MNEEILCEAPGPGGMTCSLPYGHKGDRHAFSIQIPPDIAKMIERHVADLERATKAANRSRNMWMVLAVLYIGLIIWQIWI